MEQEAFTVQGSCTSGREPQRCQGWKKKTKPVKERLTQCGQDSPLAPIKAETALPKEEKKERIARQPSRGEKRQNDHCRGSRLRTRRSGKNMGVSGQTKKKRSHRIGTEPRTSGCRARSARPPEKDKKKNAGGGGWGGGKGSGAPAEPPLSKENAKTKAVKEGARSGAG